MKQSGAHTHPGNGGGGIGLVILIILGLAIVAEPIARAISSVAHAIAEVLEIVAIAAASLGGLAVIAALIYAVARLRHSFTNRLVDLAARPPTVISVRQTDPLSSEAPNRSELEYRVDRLERLLAHGRTIEPLAIEAQASAPGSSGGHRPDPSA